MVETISQVGIACTGVIAIYLSASQEVRHRMYAGLLGLAGQPFWVMTTFTNKQFGILALSVIYAYMWYRMFNNNRKELRG